VKFPFAANLIITNWLFLYMTSSQRRLQVLSSHLQILQHNMTSSYHHDTSLFGEVKKAPPDAILGLTVAYKADTHPNKVDLGVGAYRDVCFYLKFIFL